MYMIWKGRFLSLFVVVELTRVSIVWTSRRTPRSPCCTRRCWRQWRRPALSVWSESWYSHFELIKYTSFPRPVRKSKGSNHLKQTCICTPYLLKRLPRKETQKTISELDWADVVWKHWSALDESRRMWPAKYKAELLTDSNEEQKPKGLWYSHSLFICKKDFSTEHQNAAWMKKYCDVNAFSDRLKHYDSAALYIELKYVLSSFYHALVFLVCLFWHRVLSK